MGFRFRQVGGNLSIVKYWRLGQEGRNLSIVNYWGMKQIDSSLIVYIYPYLAGFPAPQ